MCSMHSTTDIFVCCEPSGFLICLTCIRTNLKAHGITEFGQDEADKLMRTKVHDLMAEYNQQMAVLISKLLS